MPTKAIWQLHKAGYSVQRILHNYPGLLADDINAALEAEEQRRSRTAG